MTAERPKPSRWTPEQIAFFNSIRQRLDKRDDVGGAIRKDLANFQREHPELIPSYWPNTDDRRIHARVEVYAPSNRAIDQRLATFQLDDDIGVALSYEQLTGIAEAMVGIAERYAFYPLLSPQKLNPYEDDHVFMVTYTFYPNKSAPFWNPSGLAFKPRYRS